MAEGDNPFANAFQPDRGGLPGFIGGLMGVPTEKQSSGSATGEALSALAALKDQGMNNQQALIKYLQTPAGQDYFTHAGPDGLTSLATGLQQMTTPAATVHNVPEGGQLYTSAPGVNNGQPQLAATNAKSYPPTTLGPQDMAFDRNGTKIAENTNEKSDDPADVKSFKFFTALGQLPPAEIQRLAALKANNATETKQVLDDMVKRGVLDPMVANSIFLGTQKITAIPDQWGRTTGNVMATDQLTGQSRLIVPGSVVTAEPPPGAAPGTTPSSGAATGVLPAAGVGVSVSPNVGAGVAPQASAATPPVAGTSKVNNNPGFGNGRDMALGAGPVAKVLGAATKLSEAIDPRLIIDAGAQANDRETAAGILRSNLQAIGTIGGGMSSNKGLIEGYVHTFIDEGLLASPHSQVQKLIRLSEVADKNIAQETARSNDMSAPNEVRKQAAETVAGWQRVKASMPDYDYLIDQEKKIRAGTAGAPTISSAAKDLVGAGTNALTETKKQLSKVQEDNANLVKRQADIDSITDPKELAAIDPRTLDRTGQIKYLRKVDQFKKGAKLGPK